MKYKIGDKVCITLSPIKPYWNTRMSEFLGSIMTIRSVEETPTCGRCYKMEEDYHIKTGNSDPNGWDWFDNMIIGIAESEEEIEMEDPGRDEILNSFLNNFKIQGRNSR